LRGQGDADGDGAVLTPDNEAAYALGPTQQTGNQVRGRGGGLECKRGQPTV
jgi:hypothetical protein